MRTIQYNNFEIYTTLEGPVTEDNFWKHDVWIHIDGKPYTFISKNEVSMGQIEALLSGNEDACLDAINMIVKFREYNNNKLKAILEQ